MIKLLVVCLSLLLSLPVVAREVFFVGVPTKKVTLSDMEARIKDVLIADGQEFKVVIEKEGNKFYWASRDNVKLIPIPSGYVITFVAVGGEGYIRIENPELTKGLGTKESPYMEHLIHRMGNITYFGTEAE
jgi:hypothetical protein